MNGSKELKDVFTVINTKNLPPAWQQYNAAFLREMCLPRWKRWVRSLCRMIGVRVFEAPLSKSNES